MEESSEETASVCLDLLKRCLSCFNSLKASKRNQRGLIGALLHTAQTTVGALPPDDPRVMLVPAAAAETDAAAAGPVEDAEDMPLRERQRRRVERRVDVGARIQALLDRLRARPGPAEPYDALRNCNCNVCWSAYDDGIRMPMTLTCGHCVCASCLGQLRQLSCPQCRAPITMFVRLHL